MKNTIYAITILLIGLMMLSQCKHATVDPTGGNGNGSGNGNDTNHVIITPPPTHGDTVCFSTQILPLIVSNCATAGCHDATSRVEGLNLTSYASIKAIAPAKSTNSTLVRYISLTSGKRMPPAPMPMMDTASINLIKKWIAQGSLNLNCASWGSNCDTTNVKYTTHIVPIMNTYCKGCHNTGNKQGSINLDNFNDVKTQTSTGKLICTITGGSGCVKMPQGASTLSACDVRKIIKWNTAGCPQ